ncbi:cytochrome P450 2D3 [Patella vulgata]|uniref:cytochrome P450 2D3 n=1 Tax=Patella vulgata TaxID=6465 RepID=UPI00217F3225|nr:cytochrome P450 2D3 [Patella vulgata]
MSNLWEIVSSYVDATTILIAFVFLLIIGFVLSKQERSGIPPGPSYWPIVGNILEMKLTFACKRHKYFEQLQEKHGDIFRIYFGSQLMIVLNDFESVDEAFVKQKDVFSIRPAKKLWSVNRTIQNGKGVIWSSGQEWKDARRMALHTLRDLGVGKSTLEERIKDETNVVLDFLFKSEGTSFCAHEIMMKATTNIISSVVFGKRYHYDDPGFLKIMEVIDAGFKSDGPFSPINEFPLLRFMPFLASKLLAITNAVEQAAKFISERVEEHKRAFSKDNINDFIDVCLDIGENSESSSISEGCLRRSILDLFLAGSDTTATTLDWALLFMILNPEVQKKCQEEIDDVVGDSRMVGWSDKSKMPYNEATLLEVQRIGNTIPASLPHTASRDTVVKGYLIPAGSLVYANMYACHLDSRYWKEPLKFKPERFIDDTGKVSKHNASFMPFSTGPRMCAGEPLARMELFLFFTNVLQRFSLSTPSSETPSANGICGLSLSPPPYSIHAKRR